jgi:two-component system OmpR family sensor kinase
MVCESFPVTRDPDELADCDAEQRSDQRGHSHGEDTPECCPQSAARDACAADLRHTARLIVEDLAGSAGPGRIRIQLPESAMMSNLASDAFLIVLRNLIENALRHGNAPIPIEVSLKADGRLGVANDGAVVPTDDLSRLTQRFERAHSDGAAGSGLDLAIVKSIADRTGSTSEIRSPRASGASGFEATFRVEGGRWMSDANRIERS